MAFDAYTYGHSNPEKHGDQDIYNFHEGGVLEIRPAEETGKHPTYYAPHKWEQVIPDPDHKPGEPSSNYDVKKSVL